MKIENQVTRLELSKELKKLGVEQDSFWVWVNEKSALCNTNGIGLRPNHSNGEGISAFTVTELGEMLPDNIEIKGKYNPYWLEIFKIENRWSIGYKVDSASLEIRFVDNTEANARAKCLIWLIENNKEKIRGSKNDIKRI